MKRSLLFTLILLLCNLTVQLYAQPTLTQANNFPEIGDALIRINADPAGVSIGASGANVTWDFQDLTPAGGINEGTMVAPAATGFAANFPTANIVRSSNDLMFYDDAATAVDFLGFMAADGAGGFIEIAHTNPLTEIQYPFTFGDSFTDDGVRTYLTYTGDMSNTVEADGFGNLSLPNGFFNDVLRVKKVYQVTDTDAGGAVAFLRTDTTYLWYSEDSRVPLLSINYIHIENGGTVNDIVEVTYADVQAESGGPDDYGYTWTQSGGCIFRDITERGTLITGLADDNFVGPFNMGFDFQYYWGTYGQLWVGSNGYASFGGGIQIASIASGFPIIPSNDGKNNFVAGLLTDLSFAGANNPGRAYYYSNNIDTFILMFKNVPFWVNNAAGYGGSNTFEFVFTKADSSVALIYQDMSVLTDMDAAYQGSPNPVIIGIENPLGDGGLQYSSSIMPEDNICLKFDPPAIPLIDVIDVYPAWNNNTDNGGRFLIQGTVENLMSNIKNSGSVDISTPITVLGQVFDANGILFGGNFNTSIPDGLAQGESQTIITWQDFPALEGDYSFRVTATTANDINAVNDVRTSEIVVVDTTGGTYNLSYVPNFPSVVGQVSWNGGADYNDGVGMYIEPPFYPAKILAVEYGNATNGAGFRAAVYDDDGANGSAGTELAQHDIAAANVLAGDWTAVDFSSDDIVIEDGGFYAAWLMEAGGVALTTDLTPPFSNRTFEILASTWAPYREADAADYLIRVTMQNQDADTTTIWINPANGNTFATLHNAQPNPANADGTLITFELPQATDQIVFSVADMTGKQLSQRSLNNLQAGEHTLRLNTQNLSAGTYIYSIQTNGFKVSKQLVVIR